MVDIKTAVANAMEYAEDALGASQQSLSLRLEEIESSTVRNENVWLITLSSVPWGDAPLASTPEGASLLGADPRRDYKVFAVSKATGEVKSMKMRLFSVPA